MAYKFNSIPSKNAYQEEIADFWEIQALKEFEVPISSLSILKLISIEFDELNNDGIESEEDFYSETLHQVFSHLRSRQKYSNQNYPFNLTKTSISFDGLNSFRDYLYTFLLLTTRFNMTKSKTHNEIDGTLLFEFLCADVAKNFFGENSNSYVFGTGNPGSFKEKVKQLIKNIDEGFSFKNPDNNTPTKNDDGIDVVVWKEFADRKKGKLIGFGQCKTGTNWRDHIDKLKPDTFCKKWFIESPVYEPLRMIFLTDTMNKSYNYYGTQQDYLVFNRFRIIEYAINNTCPKVKSQIVKWVNGALKLVQD